MPAYIARRLLWMVAVLVAVTFITFIIFYLLPAVEPAALRAGKTPSPALLAHIRQTLGLQRPWYDQYLHFLDRLLFHLDLGYSYQYDISVRSALAERLPATISLTLGAALLWLAGALALGTLAALRRHSLLDRLVGALTLLGISAPVYWLALLALFLFADVTGKLHLLPGAGSYVPISEEPLQWLESLVLPWLVLAISLGAFYARLLRANLTEVLAEPYIRTARAKGISQAQVLLRHALRPALTPFLTAAGMDIALLLGGAILTETAFNIPGIGRLLYEAVLNGDLPMIQGTVLVGAIFIVVMNAIVDLLYVWLDPRVRLA
ncbi:MAG TPA: ABC transporter permease [Solirubrobacteraceae bacterium]|nr:ABC transporter permease [Solirubrobacteraceae bacterium]